MWPLVNNVKKIGDNGQIYGAFNEQICSNLAAAEILYEFICPKSIKFHSFIVTEHQ